MTNTSEASRPAVWQGDGPGLRYHCRSEAKGMLNHIVPQQINVRVAIRYRTA